MVLAHMGHPWYEEAIVVSRKQPNVFLEQSALFYRPWQYYNILICAQEYGITDKIFFGTDFPFARVEESVDGLLDDQRAAGGHRPAAGEPRDDAAHPRLRSRSRTGGRATIRSASAAAGTFRALIPPPGRRVD